MVRLALLYEHPAWSLDLVARMRERGIDFVAFDVGAAPIDLGQVGSFDLWVNRVNAMPSAGRPASVVAATGHLLLALQQMGQPIVNGAESHRIGGSKMAQAALFASQGLNTPTSIQIWQAHDAIAAAQSIGYPVLTKPNVGGSGAGVARYDDEAALRLAVENGQIDLGIDGTGLVQQVINSGDGRVHRVEMLGTELFYGTSQPLQTNGFNYCAADGCATAADEAIELTTPPGPVVDAVAAVMAAARTDVGGAEFLVDAVTGEASFFDFNPYSNFVAGADELLGFNPIDRYIDFVLSLER